MDDQKAVREAAVYASQSGETPIGGVTRTMALEQLSFLSPRGNWRGSSESGMDQDFVSRSGSVASPLPAFPYPPLQKAQGRGTLSIDCAKNN
jgi:hypothetical protein